MQYKMVKYSIKEIMEYTFKIIGEYIYMLGQLQKQFKSFGDYDLAKVVRTERLAIIRNLDKPNRFANFLDSWIDWGCPQTQDDNFKYFRNIFLGFDEYVSMQEDLHREGLAL